MVHNNTPSEADDAAAPETPSFSELPSAIAVGHSARRQLIAEEILSTEKTYVIQLTTLQVRRRPDDFLPPFVCLAK